MKILLVIDMQNDFIDGSLGTIEAKNIVDNVKKKIEEYYNNDQIVIFTKDTHDQKYLSSLEGINLPVKHCIKNTDGWQISSKLNIKDSLVIEKSTFGSKKLPNFIISELKKRVDCQTLKIKCLEHIEIIGLCTDICVINNALLLKAHFPNTIIKVDSNCCAGVTPTSHNNALHAMKICHIEIN
ncbi:MAG: isochorismatase family cysteine hydrolase [Erysipelotrichaceae bacterium]